MRVDLNADVGEIDGTDERPLLMQVTSANIACGFHAGSPQLMRKTVELASNLDVAVGAHPGFADRDGFGRRAMHLSEREVGNLIACQLEALSGIASAAGVRLKHVKPHGALYNMAACDVGLASAIALAVKTFDPALVLVGLAGSELIRAGELVGLRVAGEGFADRAYRSNGTLVPRSEPGAVLRDTQTVIDQALRLIGGEVVASTGENVRVRIESLCVHGDTPNAAELAAALRRALVAAGVRVEPLEV
ncbi:MAG: 5-oxoprolinase subunit PxpA [Vicinamibacterales bacterium]